MRLAHNDNLLVGIIKAKQGGTASCDGGDGGVGATRAVAGLA